MKHFKTHIKLLAGDANGCHVILAAYEVIDDTVMTRKTIISELLGKGAEMETVEDELLRQAEHIIARMPLLYPMSIHPPKWLITEEETKIVDQVREIRKETSKKDPEKRRTELVEALSQPLLDLITAKAEVLVQSSFGCQFITEVLMGGIGNKDSALSAIASLVDTKAPLLESAHAGRMLKSLTQGGTYDRATKAVVLAEPALKFGDLLYQRITADDDDAILQWASGPNSFVVLAMLEAVNFEHIEALTTQLRRHKANLSASNTGAQIILEKVSGDGDVIVTDDRKTKKKSKVKSK